MAEQARSAAARLFATKSFRDNLYNAQREVRKKIDKAERAVVKTRNMRFSIFHQLHVARREALKRCTEDAREKERQEKAREILQKQLADARAKEAAAAQKEAVAQKEREDAAKIVSQLETATGQGKSGC